MTENVLKEKIEVLCKKYNYTFIGWKDGIYKSHSTYAIVECNNCHARRTINAYNMLKKLSHCIVCYDCDVVSDMPYVNYDNIRDVKTFVDDKHLKFVGEIWKEHPIYTNYQFSNYGRCRRKAYSIDTTIHNEKITLWKPYAICKQCIRGNYFRVTIDTVLLSVNRLMCETFNIICDEKEADHINSVRYDNRIENLRWLTHKQNVGNENTLLKRSITKNYTSYKKPVNCYDSDNNLIKEFESEGEAAEWFGCSKVTISRKLKTGKLLKGYKLTLKPYIKVADDEVFRQIPGKKKGTLVSNYGTVKVEDGIYTKGGICEQGYLRAVGKYVHQWVALAFIDNPENKKKVDHINGDKTDNRLVNLRWVTDSENMENPITQSKLCKKVGCYDLEGNLIKTYDKMKDVSVDGYSPKNVSACCNGAKHTHLHKIWKFIDK